MGRYLLPLALAGQQQLESCNRSGAAQSSQFTHSSAVWVRLAALPNPYSHDEAMLLCRHSDDEWLVWIPDHGEAILHRSEFYFDTEWN